MARYEHCLTPRYHAFSTISVYFTHSLEYIYTSCLEIASYMLGDRLIYTSYSMPIHETNPKKRTRSRAACKRESMCAVRASDGPGRVRCGRVVGRSWVLPVRSGRCGRGARCACPRMSKRPFREHGGRALPTALGYSTVRGPTVEYPSFDLLTTPASAAPSPCVCQSAKGR